MTNLWKVPRLKRHDGLLLRMPWRALVGASSAVLGLLLGAAAFVMQAEVDRFRTLTHAEVANDSDAREMQEMLKLPQPTPTLTRDEEHLQDLQGIFEVARANNLRLGQVDHQWAPDPKPGIRLHTMTVQMSDSYPRIRSFLHSMAETFPHLGIHSLTVERPDLQATEVDTTFQFLMLYRASAGSTNVD